MADDRIEISIELDDGSIRRGFARFEDEARKSSHEASGFFREAFAFATGQALFAGVKEALNKVKEVMESTVEAATEFEGSVNRLNTSLKLSGTYSEEASLKFQEMAEGIQKTTTYSDAQVISIAALARTYTRTNDEAEKLTKTAIDFAEAVGIDAESAVRRLGGTLSGDLGGGLTRLNPALRNFTQEQLKAGAAIESFSTRFAGAAIGNADTYGGSIKKLGNAFESLLTAVGKIVTESPEIKKIISTFTSLFTDLASNISKARPQIIAYLGDVIQGFVSFNAAFGNLVLAPIELVWNAIRLVFNGLVEMIQGGITLIVNAASKLVSYFAPNSELAKNLQIFAESSALVFQDMAKNTDDSISKIFSTDKSQAITGFFQKLSEDLMLGNNAHTEALSNAKVGTDELSLSVLSIGDVIHEIFGKQANQEIIKFANSMDASLRTTGVRAVQAFGGAMSSGMAAVGRTLVNGGNLFKAFGAAMLSAMGQALVTEGAARIVQGVARVAASYGADPTGWTLISVGSAMSVLGGAMAALGGNSGSSGAPAVSTDTSGATGGGSPYVPATEDPAAAISRENQQRVVVNVQGHVLDSKESGMRIVDILNEAFNSQGAKVLAT